MRNDIGRARFAELYAAGAGKTVPQLLAEGLRFLPCKCGHDNCIGWQVIHVDEIQYELSHGDITQRQVDEASKWAERWKTKK